MTAKANRKQSNSSSTPKNSSRKKKTTRHNYKESSDSETTSALAQEFELDTELHSESSEPFVGQWNQLVSTTNWEKGQIILDWREKLIEQDVPASQYSDEAWSKLVGGVTAQHVGRLRRVFQKFGESRKDYPGLYWSHFHAAIDWNDPELWLEGAIQNNWSVSQMRKQRWETMGSLPEDNPDNYQVISAELDEDFEPAINKEPQDKGAVAEGPRPDGPDFGDEASLNAAASNDAADGAKIYAEGDGESVEFVKPFANIGDMPEDLMEAFEAYKLAILHHKAEDWQQISCDDVLASLDALKELAKAPSADEAPF